MKSLLQDERVETWRDENPRQWWAFTELEEDDELRQAVLAAVLSGRMEDEAIDSLLRFAEALETHQRAVRAGTVGSPPGDGERRSFPVTVTRMARMNQNQRLFFRVDFRTDQGWSGFFDTTSPDVVERIAKIRSGARPLTIVGEVIRRPYDFLVELDHRVRIV